MSDFGCVIKSIFVIDHEATGRLAREMRKARGLTLAAVARRMGCSVMYLCDLEHGHRAWSDKWGTRFNGAMDRER